MHIRIQFLLSLDVAVFKVEIMVVIYVIRGFCHFCGLSVILHPIKFIEK